MATTLRRAAALGKTTRSIDNSSRGRANNYSPIHEPNHRPNGCSRRFWDHIKNPLGLVYVAWIERSPEQHIGGHEPRLERQESNHNVLNMDVIAGRQPWLDVVRGIAVAGMIVANNPGSWDHVYWPLAHAPWHGWTVADLIFPLFLFIVGVSISFAFSHSPLGNQRLQSNRLGARR